MNNYTPINLNDENNIGIYKIVTPSGRIYIGMTNKSFKSRWSGHHKDLKNQVHKCPGLQHSYNKYGWESFQTVILEEYIRESNDNDRKLMGKYLFKRELDFWNEYKNAGFSLLNGEPTGTGSVFHSEETRRKIGIASKRQAEERRKKAIASQQQTGEIKKKIIPYNDLDMINRLFTPNEINSIKYDYENGMRIIELSKKYNKSNKSIGKLIRNKKFIKPDYQGVTIKQLCANFPIEKWYFNEEYSLDEIAKLVGYSKRHLTRAISYLINDNEELSLKHKEIKAKERVKRYEDFSKRDKIECVHCKSFFSYRVIKPHERTCICNPNSESKRTSIPNTIIDGKIICIIEGCNSPVSSNKSKTCFAHHLMKNK